jgi:hypothetical protein
MKRAVRLLLYGSLCLAATISAADRFSFSGSYTLTGTEGPRFEKGTVKKLRVVQTDASIEVTQTIDGHPYTNVYPFDGKEGIYVSPAGAKGTCKAQSKKNYLILESVVTTRPDVNDPLVQIHTKQKWEVSRDLKTLTIRFAVDSPQSALNFIEPWTDIYKLE